MARATITTEVDFDTSSHSQRPRSETLHPRPGFRLQPEDTDLWAWLQHAPNRARALRTALTTFINEHGTANLNMAPPSPRHRSVRLSGKQVGTRLYDSASLQWWENQTFRSGEAALRYVVRWYISRYTHIPVKWHHDNAAPVTLPFSMPNPAAAASSSAVPKTPKAAPQTTANTGVDKRVADVQQELAETRKQLTDVQAQLSSAHKQLNEQRDILAEQTALIHTVNSQLFVLRQQNPGFNGRYTQAA